MQRRFILTGAPGAGKTALIRQLESRGHEIVEEAATDVIALAQVNGLGQPWEKPDFITEIARLQVFRETAPMRSGRRFSDRSLFCTLALAEWLGHEVSPDLLATADLLAAEGWYQRQVMFINQLGFIENTEARRISLPEATRFGAVHETVYRRYGFDLVRIAVAPLAERTAALLAACP